MPETHETQTSAGGDSSVDNRPSDTEAAHHNEGGHSFRSQHHGDIGGDMGRDETKGSGQGETGDTATDQAGSGASAAGGLPPTAPGGEMEHQDPAHAEDLDKAIDQRAGGDDLGGDDDRTYNPDQVEANRMREQGNGVGQKDLDAQRD